MNAKKRLAVELKHIQEETHCQTNTAADEERALISVVPGRPWAPMQAFVTLGYYSKLDRTKNKK